MDLNKTNFKKAFLIAEIGINHNSSVKLAKKLIDLAKNSGFDAVKFQKRNPDISTPESQKLKIRNTPWGDITYLDYKKKNRIWFKRIQRDRQILQKIENYMVCIGMGYRKS